MFVTGVRLSPRSWAAVLARLEKVAAEAGEKWNRVCIPEFGMSAQCGYLGQASGDPERPYIKEPWKWRVAKGNWRAWTEVSFAFHSQATEEPLEVVAVQCRNAQARGVPQPTRLISRLRYRRGEAAAVQAEQSSGCPCKFLGPEGDQDHDENPILHETKLTFEWGHVRNAEGRPHTAQISYQNLAVHARPVPHCPVRLRGSPGLRYSLAFLDAFAENVLSGLTYQGVMYDGPAMRAERDVPHGGVDVLDAKAYWLYPSGALRCMSARELQEAGAAAAAPPESEEEYEYVAASFGYLYLGGRCDVTDSLQEPGTMQDRRWSELAWSLPETALSPCWWLTNPKDIANSEATPRFLNKSIAILRAELHRLRVATLGKTRDELRRRQEQNAQARARLFENSEWRRAAGTPQQNSVREPTSVSLASLASWAEDVATESLRQASQQGGPDAVQHSVYAWKEIQNLLNELVSEHPDDIHRERFHTTPHGMFTEIFRALLVRAGHDLTVDEWTKATLRRAALQREDGEDEPDGDDGDAAEAASADPDPDGFVPQSSRLPKGHSVATAHAEAVLLDRVRALFDQHYDDVFLRDWSAKSFAAGSGEVKDASGEESPPKAPRRRGAHRVDAKVLEARLAQRFEIFDLPEQVKHTFRHPKDESDWARLELLGHIVADAADGIAELDVTNAEEMRALWLSTTSGADPVLMCGVELGGLFFGRGTRVLTRLEHGAASGRIRLQLAGWLPISLSAFGEALRTTRRAAESHPVQVLAGGWREAGDAPQRLSAHAAFTRLQADLGQVLWQKQCYDWGLAGKAWATEAKITGCVRWYLKGQHVGQRPVFDGICARCGALLYGSLADAVGNKKNGQPINLQGAECNVDAQPPFLLRWPPSVFADMVPDVFAWDAGSNKLSLRQHHQQRPPWKAKLHHRQKDLRATWLYCDACHQCLFVQSGRRGEFHSVP